MTSALPNFLRHLSKLLTVLNQNVVKVETSKALTLLERETLAMMHRLVYQRTEEFYAEHIQRQMSKLGIVTSGSTLANISALWAIRDALLKPTASFGGAREEGLHRALAHYDYEDAVLIGSEHMHYSIDKAAALTGLGTKNIIRIPLDENGSIDINQAKRCIEECRSKKKLIIALIGIGGTTETGNIDDLEGLAQLAAKYKVHFHVDAAWGGPILFSDQYRHLLCGIEKADSVVICGHKQMYLPQGISIALFRDPQLLDAIATSAHYQARNQSFDLGKHSPEGSRPAVSLYLHAALHILGKTGYAHLIEEGIRKAHALASWIEAHEEFELIEEPKTNIVVYRYMPPELRNRAAQGQLSLDDDRAINQINEQLQEQQFKEGQYFMSRTTLTQTKYGVDRPIVVIRAVVANPFTRETDLQHVLNDQLRIATDLLATDAFVLRQPVEVHDKEAATTAHVAP